MKKILMKRLLYFWMIFLAMPTLALASSQKELYIADYAQLLKKHVQVGEKQGIVSTLVDYVSWRQDPLHQKALVGLQGVNPEYLSGKAKMAFWINAYNLLTVDLILKTGEKESIRNQGGFFSNVWKSHDWKIHGKTYTLDAIEHQILRPMGDARVHMAINCASLSCPDLLTKPYVPEQLDMQLDAQVNAFLSNSNKGVLVSEDALKVSEIFDWFEQDFEENGGVIEFIRHYLMFLKDQDVVDYFDYNWHLNSQS